jgi:hypothetical protein
LKPPIPAIRNRALQLFSKPRVFDDNGGEFMLNSLEKNYFDGWSFVVPNNQNNPNNMSNLK